MVLAYGTVYAAAGYRFLSGSVSGCAVDSSYLIAMDVILNPTGRIEPMHIGQMFFDQSTEIFYQARGPTSDDWRLVPPADFVGSFVKIYDFFIGIPQDDPNGFGGYERSHDAQAITETMAMGGLRVLQAFAWKTASGETVAMTRLKFDRTGGLSVFFGFDEDARPHKMPSGIGFIIEDGAFTFNGLDRRVVTPGETILFRITKAADEITAHVDDIEFARVDAPGVVLERPMIALFDRSVGSRRTAPGYDQAMKRLQDR